MISEQKDPHRYDDMLELPHPVSKVHPRMDLIKRAAQFAPFAALTGYEDAITEAQRLTDRRVELDENSKELLDEKLQMIWEQGEEKPEVEVTYFVPDQKKEGGAYVTVSGRIKKIDPYQRHIIMTEGMVIPIDEIVGLELVEHCWQKYR